MNSLAVGGALVFNRTFFYMAIFIWLFFSACGYRFADRGDFPQNIQSVKVKMIENHSAETGVENIFTNDFIYEFTRNKNINIVSSDTADAVFSGVIKSIYTATISRKGVHTTLERRVYATMDLTLTDPDGTVIWSAKGVSDSEAFAVSDNKQTTERNKRVAIEILSKRLAESVYYRLTDDF